MLLIAFDLCEMIFLNNIKNSSKTELNAQAEFFSNHKIHCKWLKNLLMFIQIQFYLILISIVSVFYTFQHLIQIRREKSFVFFICSQVIRDKCFSWVSGNNKQKLMILAIHWHSFHTTRTKIHLFILCGKLCFFSIPREWNIFSENGGWTMISSDK